MILCIEILCFIIGTVLTCYILVVLGCFGKMIYLCIPDSESVKIKYSLFREMYNINEFTWKTNDDIIPYLVHTYHNKEILCRFSLIDEIKFQHFIDKKRKNESEKDAEKVEIELIKNLQEELDYYKDKYMGGK